MDFNSSARILVNGNPDADETSGPGRQMHNLWQAATITTDGRASAVLWGVNR